MRKNNKDVLQFQPPPPCFAKEISATEICEGENLKLNALIFIANDS